MTGLLTRSAVSNGLHRDGSHFPDMTPFEAEMRRRIWWYICLVDLRFGDAQAIDMAITERIFNTKQPTNINDEDLWVDMELPPVQRECFTDMSMTLLRCDLWRLLRRVRKYVAMSTVTKKGSVREELAKLHKSIEGIRQKVLRHLDMELPLHRLIETLAEVNFARAELLLNYRAHFGPNATSATALPADELRYGSPCMAALSSLEWMHQARLAEGTRRWIWVFRGCPPWDSLGILLVGLLASTAKGEWPPLCERAWQAVRTEVERIPGTLKVGTASLREHLRGYS